MTKNMQILWNNKYKNSCRPFQERSPVPPPGGADDEVCHHHHHLLDQLTTTNLNPTSTVSSSPRSQLQSQLASQMQGMGATDQMQVLQSLQHMAGRKQKEVRKIIFFYHFHQLWEQNWVIFGRISQSCPLWLLLPLSLSWERQWLDQAALFAHV